MKGKKKIRKTQKERERKRAGGRREKDKGKEVKELKEKNKRIEGNEIIGIRQNHLCK